MAKRRKKAAKTMDSVEVSMITSDAPDVFAEKARAVERFLAAAHTITTCKILSDEQVISAMVVALVVWTKMALLSGHYEVSDEQARDDLIQLMVFAFDETVTERGQLQ